MAKVTPAEFAEKHNRRMKAALPDIKRGIERVKESPMEKAAAKEEKMIQNLLASIASGKWKRGLLKVTLQEWKDKTINKGLNRIPSGLDAARKKIEEFAAKLLKHTDAGQALIKDMPDLTFADSQARMLAFSEHMHKFKKDD